MEIDRTLILKIIFFHSFALLINQNIKKNSETNKNELSLDGPEGKCLLDKASLIDSFK